MQSVVIGGRQYVDPDVLALTREAGRLVDPRSAVVTQARRLNEKFVKLGGDDSDPMVRLKILASLCGLEVEPMDSKHAARYSRDAVLLPTDRNKRIVMYNTARTQGRIAFSIAHEIAHTFFPSTGAGARFRTMCDPESREANELERLCDLAASELLMPLEQFRRVVGVRFGLGAVDSAAARFGSSVESTVYRMATAHPGLAVAGLLVLRRRRAEEAALRASEPQLGLFGASLSPATAAARKYRRQSFFTSEACGHEHLVPWNKSFSEESIVYAAGREQCVRSGMEKLPNRAARLGKIEAMPAPYQRSVDSELPDILFFWAA